MCWSVYGNGKKSTEAMWRPVETESEEIFLGKNVVRRLLKAGRSIPAGPSISCALVIPPFIDAVEAA